MTDSLTLVLPVLSVMSGAVILRAVALMTGGIEFDDWGSAFAAVVIAHLVGWLALSAGAAFGPHVPPIDPATFLGLNALVQTVLNLASLGIAAALMSGIHIKGLFGLLVAAVVLTLIDLAMSYLPFLLATG